jgi:hypothetical protein
MNEDNDRVRRDGRPPVPGAGSGGDDADGVSLRLRIAASKREQHFGSCLQHITPVDKCLVPIGPRHNRQLRQVWKV